MIFDEPVRWRTIATSFLLTRGVLFLVGAIGLAYLQPAVKPSFFPDHLWLDGWTHWDAQHYVDIATNGYKRAAKAAFMPLYPMVMKIAALPFGLFLPERQALALGGLLVSYLAFFLALVGLWKIAERRFGADHADRAVWLMVCSPFALFYSAVYSEALFLAVVVWAFYFADQSRWWAAGVLAGCAALTRVPGLMVAPALGLEYMRQRRWKLSLIRADILLLVVPALMLVAHLIILDWGMGDASMIARARGRYWNRPVGFGNLAHDFTTLFRRTFIHDDGEWRNDARLAFHTYWVVQWSNVLFGIGAVVAAVFAFRILGVPLGFFAASTVLAQSLHALDATGRVGASCFPLFLVLACALSTRTRVLLVAVPFFLLQMLLAFYFTHWFAVT